MGASAPSTLHPHLATCAGRGGERLAHPAAASSGAAQLAACGGAVRGVGAAACPVGLIRRHGQQCQRWQRWAEQLAARVQLGADGRVGHCRRVHRGHEAQGGVRGGAAVLLVRVRLRARAAGFSRRVGEPLFAHSNVH